MKLKVIGSTAIKRELYYAAAYSLQNVALCFFEPDAKPEEIQREIDADSDCDFIVLALGEDAAEGLVCNGKPIAVARIHNSAQLVLGSRRRFCDIFCENEDSPCWLDCYGNFPRNIRGVPCYVGGMLPKPQLPIGTREYIADLGFLSSLLNGDWDNDEVFILKSGERIIKDALVILDSEAI